MPLDDAALLERWTTQQDAEAFDEIVRRFADPVYGTCLRILRNDGDAEEVAQECFLLLVRSGGSVRTSLGGWLHRVATTKSLDRIRREVNRRKREQVFGEAVKPMAETGWDDIQEQVDAAIDTLPEGTRDVIIAHFLQRRTHEEIATDRNVSRRAVSYRIQRGLESIRRELRRRGVSVSVSALSATFAIEAVSAPLSLKASLGKLAIAAGTTSGVGGTTATGSLLGSLILMKTKSLFVAGVLLLIAAGIFFAFARASREGQDPPVGVGNSANVAQEEEPAVETASRPVAVPNDEGVSNVVDKEVSSLEELLALSRAELESGLKFYPPIEDPAQQASVSGVVLDQDGYAISDAVIALVPTYYWGKLPGAGELARTVASGVDGAYHIEGIARGGHFWAIASKPGFTTMSHGTSNDAPIKIEQGMRATVDFTLKTGPTLRGRVLTEAGAPVPDALVQCIGITGPRSGGFDERRSAKTGPEGQFTLGFTTEERGFVTSFRVQSARHGAATFPDVQIQSDHAVELRLTTPAIIQGTVKNSSGDVVAGARLTFYAHKAIEITGKDGPDWGNTVHAGYFIALSDGSGRFATELDAGMDYDAEIKVAGFHGSDKRDEILELVAGETREYNPVLEKNTIDVRAIIVGQQSGERFTSYVPVDAIAKCDGEDVGYSQQDGPTAVRFALPPKPGSYTFRARYMFNPDLTGDLSKPYELDGGDDIEIELNVPDPESFTVRAVDQHGGPVAGASVHFLTEDSGTFHTPYQTNAEGRLDEPLIVAPDLVTRLYVEQSGYATAWGPVYEDQRPGSVHPEETFVLWPGAGFEGDLVDDESNPQASTPLSVLVTNRKGQTWPIQVTTDGDGHFTVVDQAPADVVDIAISSG